MALTKGSTCDVMLEIAILVNVVNRVVIGEWRIPRHSLVLLGLTTVDTNIDAHLIILKVS